MIKKYFLKESGLTLIELLAALAISMAVIGAIYGVLNSSLIFNNKSQSHIDLRQEANIIITQLRQQHQVKIEEYELDYLKLITDKELSFKSIEISQMNKKIINRGIINPFNDLFVKFTLADNQKNTFEIDTVIEAGSERSGDIFITIPKDEPTIIIPSNLATYVDSTIELTGGARIIGNVRTNSAATHSISLNGGASILDGNIYVPKGAEHYAIKAPEHILNNLPTPLPSDTTKFFLPPFPTFPDLPLFNVGKVDINGGNDLTIKLNSNVSFKEIKISSNRKLTLEINSDTSIVVDSLNILNGHIEIIGKGKLTIYIRDQFNMGAGSTINCNRPNYCTQPKVPVENLNVYLKGNSSNQKTLKLDGNQKIFGSLYAESSNIEITGGGGFQGHIFTGGTDVKINGGGSASSSLIYAPNANVNLTGGGTVTGSIIAKTLSASGGTIIKFKYFNRENLPFIQ